MKNDYDKILPLYLEYMANTMSSEQRDFVDRELEGDEQFRAVWQMLESQSESDRLKDFIADLDSDKELAALKQQTQTEFKSVKKIDYHQFRKFAALLCLFLGLYYAGYLIIKNRVITNSSSIVKQIGKNIVPFQLVLSNGKVVNFTTADSTKTIQVGNSTTIALNQHNLKYSSVDTGLNSLYIPLGQTYNLTLSDGTIVMLNAGSTLKFPFQFNGQQRNVYLEGEAFFKVTKDVKHPFIVHTSLTQIKDLGTQFDVNTYHSGKVHTSLVEGKVETRSRDGKIMSLSPGFQADYDSSEGFSKSKFDEMDVLSWMNGVYYFHNKPVDKLIDLMSRCYGVKVDIDNPKVKNIAMTGIMDKNNLLEFLNDLQTTAGVKFYYRSDILHLQ